MITRIFDPHKSYRCIVYVRMSSDKQNPRSPDQQIAEIEQEIKKLGLKWTVVEVYRDDGKSGRLVNKRPDLQRMLREIRTETVQADLLLLDTFERLGRTDGLSALRKELHERHGILILTADSHFSDPTTPQGKMYGMFEAARATEEGRVKAHQVLRGKKDLVRRRLWPGGVAPMGLHLESILRDVNGRQKKETRLIPNAETAWIVRLLFDRAEATGEGQTRLADFANKHLCIDDRFKPFCGSTIGCMLDNELYYGDFLFPKHATDIVDDVRIRECVRDEDIEVITGFCEPLVSRQTWETIQAVRNVRRELAAARRRKPENGVKQIAPLAPGLSIMYLLSGLLRCGHCGAAMRPAGMSRIKDPSGKYVYYRCTRNIDGACPNKKTVPEKWVRHIVVEHLRKRLFGDSR